MNNSKTEHLPLNPIRISALNPFRAIDSGKTIMSDDMNLIIGHYDSDHAGVHRLTDYNTGKEIFRHSDWSGFMAAVWNFSAK